MSSLLTETKQMNCSAKHTSKHLKKNRIPKVAFLNSNKWPGFQQKALSV